MRGKTQRISKRGTDKNFSTFKFIKTYLRFTSIAYINAYYTGEDSITFLWS